MELKTKIHAEDGKQDLLITREFNLPLELLFKAYIEPEFIEQWMGTKVILFENKKLGAWRFETTDPKGNKHAFCGVTHDIVPNKKMIRTFEMENTPFDVQLEFFDFESLLNDRSKLTMHIVYRSIEARDQMLKLPFAQGLNMAHNRIQDLLQTKQ